MCRSTEDPRFYRNTTITSSRFRRRNRLDIKAFSLRFSIADIPSSSPTTTTTNNNKNKASPSPSPFPKVNPLPGSLTLHYLPRISGSPLDINDSPIPSDSPAFVTLHRVMTTTCPEQSPHPTITRQIVFASRDRIRASEGVRFEVYWREEKVLKGVFRRNDHDDNNNNDFGILAGDWKVDCRCTLQTHPTLSLGLGFLEVSHAQVCIEIEIDGHGGPGVMISSDKVDMALGMKMGRNKSKKSSKKNNNNNNKSRGFVALEEIPEEREVDDDDDDSDDSSSSPSYASSSSSCGCGCCCDGESELELRTVGGGGAGDGEEEKQGLEMEIEGVKWAVDVGIWVMCLGVGYLVTRASSTTFRRRRRPFFF